MNSKKYAFIAAAGLFVLSMAVLPLAVSAQGSPTPSTIQKSKTKMSPSISGKVSIISGNTITLTSKKVSYDVDVTGAKFTTGHQGLAFGLSDIQVGDMLLVRGNTNGTSMVATSVNDITFIARNVFSGVVTAVDGNNITISPVGKKASISYTVDSSTAKFSSGPILQNAKMKTPKITISDLKVGDRIMAYGAISGTTITASMVQKVGVVAKTNPIRKIVSKKK